MNINIIAAGRLKEKYFRDAADEYLKRLGAYGTASVIDFDEVRLSDKPSASEIDKALKAEAICFRKYISKNRGYTVALCIEGEMLSSVGLSEKISSAAISGTGTCNFIIGSSYGIDETLKKECNLRLSMSKMTFPHRLARVMLLEQLYRAFQIISGGKYHK